ncbi:MAG: Uma2 family endonuclease [Myxococcota bacterium]
MSDSASSRKASALRFADAAELREEGELVRGRLVEVTRNTWRHGEVVAQVVFLLRLWSRDRPGWSIATGDPGAKLSADPDTLRGPDVGVVRAERRPRGRGVAGWLDGAPDVAIEVVGDTQSVSDVASKALEYLAAGAKLVWILDPQPKRVVVYSPPGLTTVLGADDPLSGGAVLEGFACTVRELFDVG